MAAGARSRNRAARAERAQATRTRIVAAATELFVRDGYLQTTMADIARQAGVAVQTLYLSFGSKVAVLAAAFDVTVAGDDQPVPIIEREWFVRLRGEPDGPAALQVFVDTASAIIARVHPLYTALQAAAADPEVAELLTLNKARRYETMGRVVAEVAGKARFDPTLDVRRATDLLYTVLSEETYGLMVVERGWSAADWTDWAAETAGRRMFTPAR